MNVQPAPAGVLFIPVTLHNGGARSLCNATRLCGMHPADNAPDTTILDMGQNDDWHVHESMARILELLRMSAAERDAAIAAHLAPQEERLGSPTAASEDTFDITELFTKHEES